MRGLGQGAQIDSAQPATHGLTAGQTMRFVRRKPGCRTGVVGVDLWAVLGVHRKFDAMDLCNVKLNLVDRPAD